MGLVQLTWEASGAFFDISRDGKVIAANHYGLSFADDSVSPGHTYTYSITPMAQSVVPDVAAASCHLGPGGRRRGMGRALGPANLFTARDSNVGREAVDCSPLP